MSCRCSGILATRYLRDTFTTVIVIINNIMRGIISFVILKGGDTSSNSSGALVICEILSSGKIVKLIIKLWVFINGGIGILILGVELCQ